MNVLEPIFFQCKINPLTTAICVPGSSLGSVTYAQLEKIVNNVAHTASKSGLAPGNLVAIQVADIVLHVSLLLGLMHFGAATLTLKGAEAPQGAVPDVILTDVPGRFSGQSTVMSVDQSWIEGDGAALTRGAPQVDENKICHIMLTTGSTGKPKGVAFTHKTLVASYFTHSKGPRFSHCSRFFCDLGVGTAAGFRYLMTLLSRGATIYFLGPEPADILQTFELHKIQGMGTSPYGLGEFLKFFEADAAFQVSLDHIICQGALLSPELSRRARARLCANLYSSYGSTETVTVAFGPASMIETVPGAVGYVQPGVVVEAVDNSGTVLQPGQSGSLRIRSACGISEYIGDPEATRTFFRDGYFYPGDNGYVTPDGLLVITGREKTALLIGGDTVAPETVEAVIEAFDQVAEAGVFAVNNNLGIAEIVAVIVARSPVNADALRAHCARRLSPALVPVRFVVVNSLPRNANGKLERQRLPETVAAKPVAK
jgi:acyl-coenzyme A synthetase/AMP-(fatty) acid ligase